MERHNRPQEVFILFRKKTIMAVFNLDYYAHTNEYFKINFILKCNEMYKINLCRYLSKMLKSRNNNYLAQHLRAHSELHNHKTINYNSLIIPRYNLSTSLNSFAFQSIESWNSVPSSVRNISNIRIFKLKLKKNLLFGNLLASDR